MSGIIKTIKAKDDNNIQHNIFPKTVLEAVVDSETNETLDNILADKVSKTDVVDNLLSTATDLPLSANQGIVLKEQIDNLGGWVNYLSNRVQLGAETTYDLMLPGANGAVLFCYVLGNNGLNGSNIFGLAIRRSSDKNTVHITQLDGTATSVTATPNGAYVKLDFSALTPYGYIHINVLYL